ncbi:hypothetical protein BDZ45DRAFT_752507 [Acephala macrosclerotiorum]|nr:hypothetical protein BDZ45DRAFT_752507 [Acephala macrosclerotiorum]
MGQPSTTASNAIIYLTYGAFLVFGCYVAWRLRHQSKGEWLSGNRTQTAFPLALNFIASGQYQETRKMLLSNSGSIWTISPTTQSTIRRELKKE